MANPVGYLYRVGQSRTRRRRYPRLPEPQAVGLPDIEPRLIPTLLRLPETQRAAVWLVHACQWRYTEVAEALDTSPSMVGNHVARGLARLRAELEVHSGA
jgi:DNA-directed RNA polymerase specialized sigma24 family protein